MPSSLAASACEYLAISYAIKAICAYRLQRLGSSARSPPPAALISAPQGEVSLLLPAIHGAELGAEVGAGAGEGGRGSRA